MTQAPYVSDGPHYASYHVHGTKSQPPMIKVHLDWSKMQKASDAFAAAMDRIMSTVRADIEFAKLDLMRWPFPTWAVRSRPFDWRND